ncbi:protein FAR1-RELATED SEQUENCE 5-like [Chenopodium quinoa]|uniref:protein FAR1-RELATED SEQUENCE 5-like n=1 Tax=Chenopodium quinoa TaxID=63459 RepID=UPI000B77E80A|nr:protein FAR1-RELATED SEQUENCE 5-like [Chenopodium quinoa]
MFSYFKRMVDDNPLFFHTNRVDDLGRLQDVLWVDARSRVAYEEFGDVVCFYSTYLTNEYKLPFCNFVGVNHHGKTVLFGCALVSRETAETFEWVFSNWLRCMGEKQPIGILTDQDPAMRKALKVTMQGTVHRWCIWHITKKFAKKLKNYSEIEADLECAIYDCLDCEEFEANWLEAIKKHELEDDECLQGLYEERNMWVPAFVKHLFWVGMKTTQRVESIHRFFDGFLSMHTLLHEFVERYCDALEVRCTNEKRADDNNDRHVRQGYTDFPAELVFQKIYTDAKLKEVQQECNRVIYVSEIHWNRVSNTITEFVVEDKVWYKPKGSHKEKPSKRKREYKLSFDRSTKHVTCDCRHFECHGIICRHIIRVYEINNFYERPDYYILRRWGKDVIRKHTRVKVCYHDPNKTEEVCRYEKMMVRFGTLCSKASGSIQTTIVVMQALQLVELQVEEKLAMLAKKSGQGVGTPSSVCMEKEKDSTPSTQRQGSHEGHGDGNDDNRVAVEEQDFHVKDPPLPKRPAHSTTDSRYNLCLEKPKKAKTTKNTQHKNTQGKNMTILEAQTTEPSTNGVPYMSMMNKMVPYGPQCVGGIQLRDKDDSIGYFTVVGGGGKNFQGSKISPSQGYYVLYPQFPLAQYPSRPYGWQNPVSPLSATSSTQGGYVPILPRPRTLVTPPSHASQR